MRKNSSQKANFSISCYIKSQTHSLPSDATLAPTSDAHEAGIRDRTGISSL